MEDYQQIVNFLEALDEQVDRRTKLYLIGGSTITLSFDKQNRTEDIDVVEVEQSILDLAGKESELAKKFGVYIHKVYEIDFTVPKNWRDKARAVEDLGLGKLNIYLADIHDIVLGKLARLEPKDFKDITNLFEKGHINITYLLERLNENTKELRTLEYRNNVKLAFDLIFNKKIIYRQGQAKISKD